MGSSWWGALVRWRKHRASSRARWNTSGLGALTRAARAAHESPKRRGGENGSGMLVGSRVGMALTSALVSSLWASEPAAAEPASVSWDPDWPRFRTSEAIVTGAMLLPIAGAVFLYPHPDDNWHGGILFDDWVRDAL